MIAQALNHSSLCQRALMVALAVALGLLGPTQASAGGTLVLDGATVHSLVEAPRVASVVIVDGLIQRVGDDFDMIADAERLDVSGLHIYPGLFDAFSRMGLVEVSALSATVDTTELGRFNPHLSALTAVNPASEVIPVSRSNGVTHVVTSPAADSDGIIAGQAGVLHLDGWTIEEMTLDAGSAMVIEWPEIQTRSFDFSTFSVRETPFAEAKKTAENAQGELLDWIEAAQHYDRAQAADSTRAETNLQLQALARVVAGEQRVIIKADAERSIKAAVEFAEEHGLHMILAGGRDAWKVKDILAEHDIPVILGLTQSLPSNEDDPYDQPYRAPGELQQAGVKIAFGSSAGGGFGPGGPHNSRTVPYEAAMGIPYGLSAEEALKAMTLYPAEMFGLGDKLGTVEIGKIANLIVTDGDPLEITTQVLHLIIDGRQVSTENKHRSEYERYSSRP